jgi:Spy/CpxP family protein refolding chaperone
MNYFDKPKILGILVIALLLLNFGTLAFMWLHKPPPPPPREMEMMRENLPPDNKDGAGPGGFLIHELGLNESQQKDFAKLRDEHQAGMKSVHETIKKNKDEFIKLMGSSDSVKASQFADNIAAGQKQIEMITFDHFKKVRALCDESQKKKFDEIIVEAMKMMGAPMPMNEIPPRDGDRPPPPGNRPPPPGNRPPPPGR